LGRIRFSAQFPAALVNMRKSFERIKWHIRCSIYELAFQGSCFMSLVMMLLTLSLGIVSMSSSVIKISKRGFSFGAAIETDVTEGGGAWLTERDDPVYSESFKNFSDSE